MKLFRSKSKRSNPDKPEGRRTGCAPVFDRGMDAESKTAGECAATGCGRCEEGVFFGSFLLRLSKEMNSAAKRSKRLRSFHSSAQSSFAIKAENIEEKAFAFGELLSLRSQRK